MHLSASCPRTGRWPGPGGTGRWLSVAAGSTRWPPWPPTWPGGSNRGRARRSSVAALPLTSASRTSSDERPACEARGPPMTATAYEAVFSRIQGLIVTRDLDVLSDDDEVRRIVESEIERFQRSSASGAEAGEAFANPDDVRSRMLSDLGGFSALGELIAHPDVEEE